MNIEIGENTSLVVEQGSTIPRPALDVRKITRKQSLEKVIGIWTTDNDGFDTTFRTKSGTTVEDIGITQELLRSEQPHLFDHPISPLIRGDAARSIDCRDIFATEHLLDGALHVRSG